MVGGLVQQEQVGPLPDDHAQHQARLLATAHAADRLEDLVASEIEGAEEAAQVLLTRGLAAQAPLRGAFPGQADHVLQRVVARAQHVEFLLSEVADVQALAFGDGAGQRRQRACDGLDHRGFALAVGAQDADALAREHRPVDPAHDGGGRRAALAGVAEVAVLQHQHGVGQAGGFAELEAELGVGQHGCDALHALQRLHPALRLFGFAGLGLEAVDELLQVGDLVLLAREGGLLQGHLLGAHVLEAAVVAAVALELGVLDVHGDVGHRVEEFAVVADDEQGAGVALKPGLQPHQGVQVQVVGGLVEQQQFARAHEGARELQAHAPAAGETVHRALEFVEPEAQAEDEGLRACRGVVRAGVVQGHVGVGHALAVVAGLGLRHLTLGREQGGVAFDDEARGVLVGLGHVLRDLGHAPLRGHAELALVFVQAAVEQTEQAGLARAIAAHQAHLFAGVDGERGAVKQHLGAAAQHHIADDDHAEASSRSSRVSSSTWSSPALVLSHTGLTRGKARSK